MEGGEERQVLEKKSSEMQVRMEWKGIKRGKSSRGSLQKGRWGAEVGQESQVSEKKSSERQVRGGGN